MVFVSLGLAPVASAGVPPECENILTWNSKGTQWDFSRCEPKGTVKVVRTGNMGPCRSEYEYGSILNRRADNECAYVASGGPLY